MDFVKEYNARTTAQKGAIIPALITVYEDHSFDFVTKLPPVADLIKKETGIEKGSSEPGKNPIGKLTTMQVEKIAQAKKEDFNTDDLEKAKKIVAGTARSMGIEVNK